MFQVCLVPNFTKVPHIPGPRCDQRSRHARPQAYLVSIMTNVPCILSPPILNEMNPYSVYLFLKYPSGEKFLKMNLLIRQTPPPHRMKDKSFKQPSLSNYMSAAYQLH